MKHLKLQVLLLIAVAFMTLNASAQTTPTSITISPQNPQISVGQKQTFTALSGNTIPLQGVTAVAAGAGNTCALLSNGTVGCWGYGFDGELGNGTTVNYSTTPVTVSGISDAKAIAFGQAHACVILSGGAVRCWGGNYDGQLGNGTTTTSNVPVAVSGLSGAAAIATGDNHTCALLANRTVECWGSNGDGQLGDGNTTDSDIPVAVAGLQGVSAIAAGAGHTCALLSNGTVECWGWNAYGQLGNGNTSNSTAPVTVSGVSGAVAIAAGEEGTCALLSDHTVQCWGYGGEGGLGNGTSTYYSATPVAVSGLSGAVTIAAGGYHTCALLSDGTGQCWGWNINGQLGNGTSNNTSTIPVAVNGLSGAVAMTGGYRHTCALLANGTMQCWGWNGQGMLGTGDTTDSSVPVQVVGNVLPAFGSRQVAAGYQNACALLSDGTVECWGNIAGPSSTPVAVSGLSGAVAIAEGGFHACALLSDGTVECWGDNEYGELGNGTTTYSSTPVTVSGLSGGTAIAAGEDHTCALLSDGTVECWGDNAYGQLGDGTTTQSNTPVAVTGLSGAVVAIAAGQSDSGGALGGEDHTCALLANGTVECWGYNAYGELGNNSTTNSSTPVAVTGLSGAVVAITAGGSHTCALLSGGTVQCWGENADGELGDGTMVNSPPYGSLTPVAVSDLSGVKAIAAGSSVTCALLSDGTADCWGYNPFGELGNGTTANSDIPVTVTGLGGATGIAGGYLNTCAVLSDGKVECWGYNGLGELGNGTTTNSSTPVATTLALPYLAWSSSDSTIASIDPSSGLATGVAPGTVNITASYSSLSAQTLLTVGGAAPTITSTASATFTADTSSSFTITTTGNPTPAITESGSLPSGVTFTDNGDGTATIAGTPAAGGAFPISITASNGFSPDATQSFTLTVNQAPAISSTSSATFVAGTAGSFTVAATGYPAPTLTETGALPGGVTFNAATGLLSGTPSAGTGGAYTITFTASNGVSPNATQSFTLTVNDFSFGSVSPLSISVGGSGSASVTVNSLGAFNSAVSLSVSGVPSGMSASFSSASITPAGGGSSSTTLNVSLGPGVTPATFNLTVTGTSGSLTHSTTLNVTVTADTSSTATVINQLVSSGCINNSGVGNALTSKLSAAQSFINAGDFVDAINTLTALVNELNAQSGKHISDSCTVGGVTFNSASTLLTDTQSLMSTTGNPVTGYVVSSSGAGVAGATVTILDGGTPVASATTDVTGFYYLPTTGVLAGGGAYTIEVTGLAGYTSATPATQTFTWEGTALTFDFELN
jgi:alpha-tubulin suppressor-like RCC1 family protein